jgi:hypothetical protein
VANQDFMVSPPGEALYGRTDDARGNGSRAHEVKALREASFWLDFQSR